MNSYTSSAYVRREGHYTKPRPHDVWWRRLLGQTKSDPIGWERISYTFEAPEKVIKEDWLQKLILNVLGAETARCKMLEQNCTSSAYIKTNGVESAIPNELKRTEDKQ